MFNYRFELEHRVTKRNDEHCLWVRVVDSDGSCGGRWSIYDWNKLPTDSEVEMVKVVFLRSVAFFGMEVMVKQHSFLATICSQAKEE